MILLGSAAGLGSCGTLAERRDPNPKRVSNPKDSSLATAPIEDWILALPAFEFHEESVEEFATRVHSARTAEPRNLDLGKHELFVRGDGTMPSKLFKLDREIQTLTIQSLDWEPPFAGEETITMRRVGGSWVRGDASATEALGQGAHP